MRRRGQDDYIRAGRLNRRAMPGHYIRVGPSDDPTAHGSGARGPSSIDIYEMMVDEYTGNNIDEPPVLIALSKIQAKTPEDVERVAAISRREGFLEKIDNRLTLCYPDIIENRDHFNGLYKSYSFFQNVCNGEMLLHYLLDYGLIEDISKLPNVHEMAVHNASSVSFDETALPFGRLFEDLIKAGKDSCLSVCDEAFNYIATCRLDFEPTPKDGDFQRRARNLIQRMASHKNLIAGHLNIEPALYGAYCGRKLAEKLSAEEDRYIESGLLERPKKYGKQNDRRPASG